MHVQVDHDLEEESPPPAAEPVPVAPDFERRPGAASSGAPPPPALAPGPALDHDPPPPPSGLAEGEFGDLSTIEAADNADSSLSLAAWVRSYVTKSISLGGAEAQSTEAQLAISKEVDMMLASGVWRWEDLAEHTQRAAEHPGARFCRMHLLLGIKNWEDRALAKFKGRIVALGNQVRDGLGRPVTEDTRDLTCSPLSMESSRLLDFSAASTPAAIVQAGDVSGAYLQADLGGEITFLDVPEILLPRQYRGRWKCPCVRCYKAIYGLERSGFDWDEYFAGRLASRGFSKHEF